MIPKVNYIPAPHQDSIDARLQQLRLLLHDKDAAQDAYQLYLYIWNQARTDIRLQQLGLTKLMDMLQDIQQRHPCMISTALAILANPSTPNTALAGQTKTKLLTFQRHVHQLSKYYKAFKLLNSKRELSYKHRKQTNKRKIRSKSLKSKDR